MNEPQIENPYAFPSEPAPLAIYGMTLRDYFAAKAMQGMCSHSDTWGKDVVGIAKAAYEMADLMLKARQKA